MPTSNAIPIKTLTIRAGPSSSRCCRTRHPAAGRPHRGQDGERKTGRDSLGAGLTARLHGAQAVFDGGLPPAETRSELRAELVCPQRTAKGKGKELCTPCHFQRIAHLGACRKPRVVLHNLQPKPEMQLC